MNAQLKPDSAGGAEMAMPEVSRALSLATQARDVALSVTVDSQDMYEIAAEELRGIAKKRDQIEELRKSLTRPLDESKKRIMALFRQPDEILANAEQALRGAMLTFQQAEQKKADEARRKAEEEARAERERLQAAAAEAKKTGDVAAIEDAQVALEIAEVAPVAMPAVATPKATGIGIRTTWKHEIVDFKALVIAAGKAAEAGDETLLGYLEPNTTAIGGVVRSLKGATRIPGVRAIEDKGLSVRRS
jgi:hypothetical protein